MRKLHLGILLGMFAGIMDIIPMIFQSLTLDAIVSAFFFWAVSGFFVGSFGNKINGILKGLVVSFLVLLPSAILIGWKEPLSLVPIFAMTIILGSMLGYFTDKFGK